MIVKVCGMRDGDNIREVEQLSIDWMGFIFYPKSSRYVSEVPAYLPTKCKRIGVFVDASTDEIIKKIHDFSLDAIQLHGNESPEQIPLIPHQSPLNHQGLQHRHSRRSEVNSILHRTRRLLPLRHERSISWRQW